MSEIIVIPSKGVAPLGVLDAGFAYGFGLFETIRFTQGCLSFWSQHWRRLQASAKVFGMSCEFSESDVLDAVRSLVEQESVDECMVKLSLIRNQGGEQLYVYARPILAVPESIELRLQAEFPLNPHSMLAGHKTHNYMEHFAILERARADGYYDALRLDVLGHMAETTIGNIFVIIGDRVITPSNLQGLLPGVIRGQLLDLFEVEEGSYYPDLLQGADAVFMTNSGAGILPVDRVYGAGIDCRCKSSENALLQKMVQALGVAERKHSVSVA